MASYHFSAQIIGRGKGRSAIAAAAYRSGIRLRDEGTGQEHDYSRRQGVVHTEILLPENAAPWLADRERLWNHVHQIERRRDAQLAREVNLALPHELTADERRDLVRTFVRQHFTSRGMVADLAIHAPTDNDPRNHHAHIMVTLRKATPTGLYAVKTREWNSDTMLREWREAWATLQNNALARGRHPDRVDHRTLEHQRADARARGDRARTAALDRDPEIHVGPQAQQASRRGFKPKSKTRQQASARPQGGQWLSAGRSKERQRAVDYPRIDQGSRPAYNAHRVQASADRLTRLMGGLQRREARLRLIEVRLNRQMTDIQAQLRAHRAHLPRHKDRLAQYAARDAALLLRFQQTRRRSGLLVQLLGRTDQILADLLQLHNRSLGRSRILAERTLVRSLVMGRDMHRRPGRQRTMLDLG